MRFPCYCLALSVALVLSVFPVRGEDPKPIKLLLTPAKLPTPALRYQLLPHARVAINGDAAPLYKQVVELLAKKPYKEHSKLFDRWCSQSPDQLSKDEVRKVLAQYGDVYELLDKAALYDRCDWGLLERVRAEGIGVLLPDIHEMRTCADLLRVRARLEMAEGRPDKVLLTLRTGFALARHVGETENLISFLVGTSIAGTMNGQLDQFLSQPEAPNLYNALTDLPVPLLNMRKAMEAEHITHYATFPGLAAIGADLNAGNLSEKQLTQCATLLQNGRFNYLERMELGKRIQNKHEIAKKALIEIGRPRDKVEAMPHLQVAILHALLEWDAALDNMIVWNNLPYWEQAERLREPAKQSDADRRNDPNTPALRLSPSIPFMAMSVGYVQRVVFARVRTDRKIALLRTIEAIRLHAAAHDQKLPPSLAAIKEVSIPLDPVTGKSFEYQVNDKTATLRAPPPGKETPSVSNSVIYELRIRR